MRSLVHWLFLPCALAVALCPTRSNAQRVASLSGLEFEKLWEANQSFNEREMKKRRLWVNTKWECFPVASFPLELALASHSESLFSLERRAKHEINIFTSSYAIRISNSSLLLSLSQTDSKLIFIATTFMRSRRVMNAEPRNVSFNVAIWH